MPYSAHVKQLTVRLFDAGFTSYKLMLPEFFKLADSGEIKLADVPVSDATVRSWLAKAGREPSARKRKRLQGYEI